LRGTETGEADFDDVESVRKRFGQLTLRSVAVLMFWPWTQVWVAWQALAWD